MTNDQFVPRWGESVFDCHYCHSEGLQWKEIAEGKWVPFDLINGEIHDCPIISNAHLTRDDVLTALQDMGFEAYRPRTSSWKYAFIASNSSQTLYFLIGRKGIDFKLYDHIRPPKIDENGKLYTDGGHIVRNYYKESEQNIHDLTIEIASRFITDTPFESHFLVDHGISWQEQKTKYREKFNQSRKPESEYSTRDIYDAISNGDGEDAYLGDGIWISSSGSMHDRGR